MKKILLILILSFIICPTFAQKIHFTDSTNKWFTRARDTLTHNLVSKYFFYASGTTEWYGYNYYSLSNYIIDGSAGYFAEFYIREDTDAGKVYILDNDGSDKILYNYNLHAGDTFHRNWVTLSYPEVDSVISVDTILINGNYYKKFTIKELDTSYPHCLYCIGWDTIYTYVEGIGSMSRPVGNIPSGSELEYQDNLVCFTHNGVAPLVDSIRYFYPSLTDTLYFINNCTVVGIEEKKIENIEVEAYPNPATNELTIITEKDVYQTITITNMFAQQIIKQSISGASTKIEISNLPIGVYYITLIGSNSYIIKKFVKM